MSEVVINKTRYECPPAVAAYIKQLEEENDHLLDKIQISEPQWSKENPIIIKGGKGEVTLVDYEPSKSCTNSLAISTCLKCGKCGRTFHAGKLTDDKVFKQKISYSNKIAILYPMDGGAE